MALTVYAGTPGAGGMLLEAGAQCEVYGGAAPA